MSSVTLNIEQLRVEVHVEHPSGTRFCCPDCQQELGCYDHTEESQWRHLDSCQFKTILLARITRVECPVHGVKQVRVPCGGMSMGTLLVCSERRHGRSVQCLLLRLSGCFLVMDYGRAAPKRIGTAGRGLGCGSVFAQIPQQHLSLLDPSETIA
ncbi:transposase family protein [Schlesneria sp. T3-172]|uniref:transposase family protein n=1 Tax=Schlesneria sphaerica TaxID=3373610 RepID=UPI0037C72527